MFHAFSVILYSRGLLSSFVIVTSMLQPKENLCLFVSCFYSFGEPLTHGLTQRFMYSILQILLSS